MLLTEATASVDTSAWGFDSAALPGPRSLPALVTFSNNISWMVWPERMLVYTSVYALRPKRCLEIGTFQGGSAVFIVGALDDIGEGHLYCVDPNPRVAPENWAKIQHRATMIAGPSPEALHEAETRAGGKFDWCLIDGDHSYDGVVRDLEGTLPTLADEAYILFHDAYNQEVEAAINDTFAKHTNTITDLGMISRTKVTEASGIHWGGIRMARYRRS